MSDKKIRELERRSMGGDYDAKAQLTSEYLRRGQGRCLFWVGEECPCAGAICCQMSHEMEGIAPLKNEKPERPYFLLAISNIEELESCLSLHPNGVLNVATKKQIWFHSPYKHVNSSNRVPDSSWTYLHEGIYEIKTFEPKTYHTDSRYIELRFFQGYPKTDDYSDKGVRTENLISSGGSFYGAGGESVSLPYPKNYMITGISLTPMPNICQKSYRNLVAATKIRFIVGTREFVNVPTVRVAGGMGDGAGLRSKIIAPMAPILTLPEPLELIPLQCFFIELIPFETFVIEEPIKVFLNLHGNYEQLVY